MPYRRSLEIEQRLETILAMIRSGEYSTPQIAEEIGVSVPTISRAILALKERGHRIRAEKQNKGWRYVLDHPPDAFAMSADGSPTTTKKVLEGTAARER